MKALAFFALSAIATTVMATTPAPDPQITISGRSEQTVYSKGALISNKAGAKTDAYQNLASNSGNVQISGRSEQTVGAGPFAMVRNSASGEGAYAVQDLASNVGNVTITGKSFQMVTAAWSVVSNEADGAGAKAVQNLASNNACFTCQKPPHHRHN